MNTKHLMVLVAIFFFAATLCSCSSEQPAVVAQTESVSQAERQSQDLDDQAARNRAEMEREREAILDDTDGFWVDAKEDQITQVELTDLPPEMPESELKSLYQSGLDAMRTWERKLQENGEYANPTDLKTAVNCFAAASVVDSSINVDLVPAIEAGIKHLEPEDLARTVLSVLKQRPENPEVKKLLPKLINNELSKFPEFRFNPALRYTPETGRYKFVDDINVYLGAKFVRLYHLNKANGQDAQAQFWKTHLADWYMNFHSHEGGHDDPNGESAYVLYQSVGLTADAKRAALVAGDTVLEIYLKGSYTEVEAKLRRHAFLPYDIQRAREWYQRAGLTDLQIDSKVKALAALAAKSSSEQCSYDKDECALAQKQYALAGDEINARRMELQTQ